MDIPGKAERIDLLDFRSIPMRAFHMTWAAFALCFFAWFGVAPLMPIIRGELKLTPSQVGNTIIASVAGTIFARLLIGKLCDRFGPRRAYAWLLALGSLPVMGIGLAHSYGSFLLFRLAIGAVGASFVVTQCHTSFMFAPSVIGTANATTAGWGNAGGGAAQLLIPLLFSALAGLGLASSVSWRLTMLAVGLLMLFAAAAYYRWTSDTPWGDLADLRARGVLPPPAQTKGGFRAACKDVRVWCLAGVYAACFGIELTVHNVAAMYFTDKFGVSLAVAGAIAGMFGLMNVFARSLGGWTSDRLARRTGLRGRTLWLFAVILGEGLSLLFFSRMGGLAAAVGALAVFSLFVNMSTGATYSVVPFVKRDSVGSVSGIVGAGGNLGAVAAGFLFKGGMSWPAALAVLGGAVTISAFLALAVRFSAAEEKSAQGGALSGGGRPARELLPA